MKKVAIIGPESSGKSVLTNFLAEDFNGIAIEEMAREYLEKNGSEYTLEDVEKIAKLQWEAIQKHRESQNWVFCDTELLVIELWTQEVFETSIPWVKEQLHKQPFDYFLLCKPDLPWSPDPLRETPDLKTRERYFYWFEEQLLKYSYKYSVIKGEDREMKAIQALSI